MDDINSTLNLLAKDILESDGYILHGAISRFRARAMGGKRLKQSTDVFGVFDLIALHPFGMPRFIRLTTKAKFQKSTKTIDARLKKHIYCAHIECWVWHEDKGYFVRYVRAEVASMLTEVLRWVPDIIVLHRVVD